MTVDAFDDSFTMIYRAAQDLQNKVLAHIVPWLSQHHAVADPEGSHWPHPLGPDPGLVLARKRPILAPKWPFYAKNVKRFARGTLSSPGALKPLPPPHPL